MGIEEAIKQLKHELWCMPKEPPEDVDCNEEWLRENEKIIEAKELAIKILEKQLGE